MNIHFVNGKKTRSVNWDYVPRVGDEIIIKLDPHNPKPDCPFGGARMYFVECVTWGTKGIEGDQFVAIGLGKNTR